MSLQPLTHIEAQDPAFLDTRRKVINNFLVWGGISIVGLLLTGVAGILIAIFAMGWVTINTLLLLHQRSQLENFHHYRQLESLASLHALIDVRYPLPPMRLWVISPDFAAVLAGIIQREKPQHIVEFGSGTSTLICCYSLEKSGGGQVTSFEHQEQFVATSRDLLAKHGLQSKATVIHAPLETLTTGDDDTEANDETWQWYATDAMEDLANIDLLIVDGPPQRADTPTRYPALPVLYNQLAPGAIILVDDYLRPGEHQMVNRWLDEFDLEVVERVANEKGMAILRKPETPQAEDTES